MATIDEKRQKYQDKIRELTARRNKMLQLYRLKQKLASLNKRGKGRDMKGDELRRHRENIEELEANIARKKEQAKISVIIDPKKISNQIAKLRTQISKLDD